MAWITPTFSYNGNTWTPTYPANNKQPIATLGQAAERHDSITTSGLQQSVIERVDRLFDLDFQVVPQTDLAGWDAFISWAIMGNQFQYAPDSTNLSSYVTCYLMSPEVPYKRIAFELFAITLKLRVVVNAEVGS
jgi:hypothetical protein